MSAWVRSSSSRMRAGPAKCNLRWRSVWLPISCPPWATRRATWEAPHVLPHQEERRGNALGGEGLEDRLGGSRVGPIVEREVDDASGARPAADHTPEQRAIGLVGAVRPSAPPQGGAESGEGQRPRHGGS